MAGSVTSCFTGTAKKRWTGLVGAEVEIALEIQAKFPDGVSDKLVRDVTENCRTLKFTDYGFEEE